VVVLAVVVLAEVVLAEVVLAEAALAEAALAARVVFALRELEAAKRLERQTPGHRGSTP